MAQLVRGQPNDPNNPELQLFIVDPSENLIDAQYVGFRIVDITTQKNKCDYAKQNFNRIQKYPENGPQYINVNNLYTDPIPGHKLGTGNYYAPFTPNETMRVGEYVIIWEWKLAGLPFSMTRQTFAIKEE